MIVTKAEFETNPSRYLDLVGREEIIITSEGEYIAKLTGAKSSIVDSLIGLIPSTASDNEGRDERLKKHERGL